MFRVAPSCVTYVRSAGVFTHAQCDVGSPCIFESISWVGQALD